MPIPPAHGDRSSAFDLVGLQFRRSSGAGPEGRAGTKGGPTGKRAWRCIAGGRQHEYGQAEGAGRSAGAEGGSWLQFSNSSSQASQCTSHSTRNNIYRRHSEAPAVSAWGGPWWLAFLEQRWTGHCWARPSRIIHPFYPGPCSPVEFSGRRLFLATSANAPIPRPTARPGRVRKQVLEWLEPSSYQAWRAAGSTTAVG